MWVKISDKEARKVKNRRFIAYLILVIFLMVIFAVSERLGYYKWRPTSAPDPQSWENVFISTSFLFVICFIFLGKLFTSKDGFKNNTYICTKCWKIREHRSKEDKCSCGGYYDYLDNYKLEKKYEVDKNNSK